MICNLVKWEAPMQLPNLGIIILAHTALFSCSHQYNNNSKCIYLVVQVVTHAATMLTCNLYVISLQLACKLCAAMCNTQAFVTRSQTIFRSIANLLSKCCYNHIQFRYLFKELQLCSYIYQICCDLHALHS